MKKISGIHIITGFLLTLFLISMAAMITLNFRSLYYFDIDHLGIVESSGYSKEEIIENYDAVIDYNLSWKEMDFVFPSMEMSREGKIHFQEVKELFDIFRFLMIACGIIGLGLAIYLWRKKEWLFLKLTAIFSILLPLVAGGLVAINWQRAFVLFHELFFDNDYWIFDPKTDPVITILPDTFFMHCAILIIGIVLIGSIGCGILYRKKKQVCK